MSVCTSELVESTGNSGTVLLVLAASTVQVPVALFFLGYARVRGFGSAMEVVRLTFSICYKKMFDLFILKATDSSCALVGLQDIMLYSCSLYQYLIDRKAFF